MLFLANSAVNNTSNGFHPGTAGRGPGPGRGRCIMRPRRLKLDSIMTATPAKLGHRQGDNGAGADGCRDDGDAALGQAAKSVVAHLLSYPFVFPRCVTLTRSLPTY